VWKEVLVAWMKSWGAGGRAGRLEEVLGELMKSWGAGGSPGGIDEQLEKVKSND